MMIGPLRKVASDWIPPRLVDIVLNALGVLGLAEYSYISNEWPEKEENVRGWSGKKIDISPHSYSDKMEDPGSGSRPLGMDPSDFDHPRGIKINGHNLIVTFAYVAGLTARKKDQVSILDWGGGTGQYKKITESVLPADVRLDYHCVELPKVCEAGRKFNPGVVFHHDEEWRGRLYDLVMASSALHYVKDWRSVAGKLVKCAGTYLFITRAPIVRRSGSFVIIQRSRKYETEYLGWVLNRQEFVECIEAQGMRLIREFVNHMGPRIYGAPEQNIYMGFLFVKAQPEKG